jgi:hypothetical protein
MSTPHGFARARAAGAVTALVLALASAAPAHGEIVASAPDAFTSKHEVVVPLAPAAAYARLLRIADWWDSAHTYSRDAANLTLDAKPGGCWCEKLPDGGFVEHMHVLFAWPGKMLRLSGALGPLQEIGAGGVMTFALQAEGTGTKVTLTYAVRGAAGTLEKLAVPVDTVLGQATKRFADFASKN